MAPVVRSCAAPAARSSASRTRRARSKEPDQRVHTRGFAFICFVSLTVAIQLLLSFLWQRGQSGSIVAKHEATQVGNNAAAPITIPAVIRVDQFVLHQLKSSSCVSLDWWPNAKCDFGDCSWVNASLLNIDLADPLLRSAIKALSPVVLRVGGSLADQVVYAGVPGDRAVASCTNDGFEEDPGRRVGFRGGCLPWSRWLALLDLCADVGCHVFFSVNALHGRRRATCPSGTLCRRLQAGARPPCCTTYTGEWDPSNLHRLLKATAASGRRVAGLAYGNELVTDKGIEAHLAPQDYAAEVRRFADLVRSVEWPARKPPVLLAPDTNHIDDKWIDAFLSELWRGDSARPPRPSPLDFFTHHMYPLGAGDEANLRAKLTDPSRFDEMIGQRLRKVARAVINRTKGTLHMAVSETGGAYNSGQAGVSNAFGSSFWWLDLLASLGKHAHDFACRQALVGGHYSLLDLGERRQPSPDFWATLLWRKLVSPKILRIAKLLQKGNATYNVSSSPPASASSPSARNVTTTTRKYSLTMLRGYAACARAGEDHAFNLNGGVVVLLLNLAAESSHAVRVELGGTQQSLAASSDPTGAATRRVDFLVTADGLASTTVRLNGAVLRAADVDGRIPELSGRPSSGREIVMPPLSYGFFVFPEAANSACMTPKQLAAQPAKDKRRAVGSERAIRSSASK